MGKDTKRATSVEEDSIKANLLQYELIFSDFSSIASPSVGAEVRSPLLDRKMHPRGVAKISIEMLPTVAKKPLLGIVLDAFQIDSIIAYLRGQQLVRTALEDKLFVLAAEYEVKIKQGKSEIWKSAKILGLQFFPRFIATEEKLTELKKKSPKVPSELIESEFDTLSTSSNFTIAIRTSWDDEHVYEAIFRDLKFVRMLPA